MSAMGLISFFSQFENQIDLHEAMVKELYAIKSRQRTDNKIEACRYGAEALYQKLNAFKKEESWYKVVKGSVCPECDGILFQRIGPGQVLTLNWPKVWCPHCNKQFDSIHAKRTNHE